MDVMKNVNILEDTFVIPVLNIRIDKSPVFYYKIEDSKIRYLNLIWVNIKIIAINIHHLTNLMNLTKIHKVSKDITTKIISRNSTLYCFSFEFNYILSEGLPSKIIHSPHILFKS